jgi:hypothetical protein
MLVKLDRIKILSMRRDAVLCQLTCASLDHLFRVLYRQGRRDHGRLYRRGFWRRVDAVVPWLFCWLLIL